MANVFANLPVPAGNGVGATVDTSLFAARKTVTVEGTFVSALTIEISEDGTDWAPLHTFTNRGSLVLYAAARFMRVRQSGWVQGTGNVDVGADRVDGQFSAVNVPAGNGAGVALDVSIFPEFFTVIVAGAFTGGLTIEISQDGTDYVPVLGFSNIGAKNKEMTAARLRVRRDGVDPALPGLPTVTVGAVDVMSGAAGGVGATVFVFRPGGVPGINVYVTWATLMADLVLVDGTKIIEFDNSVVAPLPCVIPAGGPYDMTDVEWHGTAKFGMGSYVQAISGATFTKLRVFRHNLRVESLSVHPQPSPVADFVNTEQVFIDDFVDIYSGVVTTVPFFSLASLVGGEQVSFNLRDWASIGANASNRLVIGGMVATVGLYFPLGANSAVYRGTIAGAGGSFIIPLFGSPSSKFGVSQPAFGGTIDWINPMRTDPQWVLNPQGGVVPAVAAVDIRYYHGRVVRLDATAGVITQILPEIAGTATQNWYSAGRVTMIKETSGVNGIIVEGYLAETINGALNYTIPPGGAAMFWSDGVSNWTVCGIDLNHVLNRLNTFTKAQGTAQVALPDNVTGITPDLTLSNSHRCALGAVAGNTRQLGVPTGAVAGFTYIFEFVQPTGPTAVQALTYNAAWWKFPGGVIPVLTATNDAKDILTFYYDGTAMMCVSQLDFRNP